MQPSSRTKVQDYPVIALLRVSSSGQADVQHGSLEQQKNEITRQVKARALQTGLNYYIGEYVEVDVSAKKENTKNRKDLRRIEALIKSRKYKCVWVDRSDRLSRDVAYNCIFANMMIEYDAEYFECENGKVDFKDETQFSFFVFRSVNAQNYSTKLSKDVRTQGRRARVNNGKDSNTAPAFGTDAHPNFSCQYVINKKEALQLNELGWHLVKTRDAVATAKYGNELGIRTKKRWTKERIDKYGVRIPPREVGGELLTGKRVLRMLTSPKVLGKGKFKDDLNQFPEKQDSEGFIEFDYAHGPVLEPKLIIALKEVLDDNKKHAPLYNDDFLLSGYLYSENGELYSGDSSLKYKGGSSTRYRYYCLNSASKSVRRFSASYLENELIKRLKELLQDSNEFKKLVDSGKVQQDKLLQSIDRNIQAVEGKISEYRESLSRFSIKIRELVMADTDNFQEALKILNVEKTSLESSLESSLNELRTLKERRLEVCDKVDDDLLQKNFKMFFAAFEQLQNCDKKRLLKALIPQIIVFNDFRVELKMNPIFYNDLIDDCHGSGKNLPPKRRWRVRPAVNEIIILAKDFSDNRLSAWQADVIKPT